jgi:hypothetical protein
VNATTPFLPWMPPDSAGQTRVRLMLSSGPPPRFLCRTAIDRTAGAPVSEWHSAESTAYEGLTGSGRWTHLVLNLREG